MQVAGFWMEFTNIPLELFAAIIVKLDVTTLMRVEQACKTWRDNLQNQHIWREIALDCLPSSAHLKNAENWREIAVTKLRVLKNMQEKKCLVRAICSKQRPGPFTSITHNCSVAGEEALITLFCEEDNYSYTSTSVVSHDLVNLRTFERETLESLANLGGLVTKNFIVTSDSVSGPPKVYSEPKLLVTDRRTGEKFQINDIGNLRRFPTTALMRQNEDPDCDSVCINATYTFYIVDLHERSWKSFVAADVRGTDTYVSRPTISYQLYGKYLAIAQTTGRVRETLLHLMIVDTESLEIKFQETSGMVDWAISDDKILLGTHNDTGIMWELKNFKGEVLSHYNMAAPSGPAFFLPTVVKIFSRFNVIAYFKRLQLYIFNMTTGELLSCVELFGSPEYDDLQLRAVSEGKFILTKKSSTRLIDFESVYLRKPIKVSILPENGTNSAVIIAKPYTAHVPFSELLQFTQKMSISSELHHFHSVCIKHDKQKGSRVSMIYYSVIPKNGHHIGEENTEATKLLKRENDTLLPWDINMLAAKPADEGLWTTAAGMVDQFFNYIKPGEVVRGSVVLYKEIFVNGEWMPVDYNYESEGV